MGVFACHPHPESAQPCQSVLQSLLLAGGQLCYMSAPLLLFLLKDQNAVLRRLYIKDGHICLSCWFCEIPSFLLKSDVKNRRWFLLGKPSTWNNTAW